MKSDRYPQIEDSVQFHGHRNVLGTHRNTIEVTRASHISRRADCIIGVEATKACYDLNDKLKDHIRSSGSLAFELRVGALSFAFTGVGIRELTLNDREEIVLRRSYFPSDRTAAVHCEAAAIDIPRPIIRLLQNPEQLGTLTIRALSSDPSVDLNLLLIE